MQILPCGIPSRMHYNSTALIHDRYTVLADEEVEVAMVSGHSRHDGSRIGSGWKARCLGLLSSLAKPSDSFIFLATS